MQMDLKKEELIWEESPSQWNLFNKYLISVCTLIAGVFFTFSLGQTLFLLISLTGILIALYYYVELICTKYKFTNQRLVISKGILTKKMDSLELYRIKDLKLSQNIIQRLVGIGTISLISSDKTNPTIRLEGFTDIYNKYDLLRHEIETCRDRRGVREIDQNDKII